jgi:hypothetical protein
MCHEPSDFYCDRHSLFCEKKIGKNLKKHVCSIYNLFFQQKFAICENHISFYKEKIAWTKAYCHVGKFVFIVAQIPLYSMTMLD